MPWKAYASVVSPTPATVASYFTALRAARISSYGLSGGVNMPRSNMDVRPVALRALSTQRESLLAISRICGSLASAPVATRWC